MIPYYSAETTMVKWHKWPTYMGIPGEKILVTDDSWTVQVNDCFYTGPSGMPFDGGSIPTICGLLWRLLGPPLRTKIREAFLPHDAAYKGMLFASTDYDSHEDRDTAYATMLKSLPVERSEADDLMYILGRASGASRARMAAIWWAVRRFGRGPFTREQWIWNGEGGLGGGLKTVNYTSLRDSASQKHVLRAVHSIRLWKLRNKQWKLSSKRW